MERSYASHLPRKVHSASFIRGCCAHFVGLSPREQQEFAKLLATPCWRTPSRFSNGKDCLLELLRVRRFRAGVAVQIAVKPIELPVQALDKMFGFTGPRQIVVLPRK